MAEKEKTSVDFNHFMFGKRTDTSSEQEEETNKEEAGSFDLVDTTETIIETYHQLSPYVKEITNMIKKWKG
ncbi:hypothetical protein ACFFGV_14505 [Pontibacillus salicampi]|uniref:Uncharacterized protein n=1 Tax=Pontibacillus salicampi TaxID=1449801 RepID=A0ABV6LQU2_9BACI